MSQQKPPIGVSEPDLSEFHSFAEHMKYVSISQSHIEQVASELASHSFAYPDFSEPIFPGIDEAGTDYIDILDFLFLGNTLNFAFRDFDNGSRFAASYDGTVYDGAYGMWACLKDAYDSLTPILSGRFLQDITISELEDLFEPANGTRMPLLEKRREILNQAGQTLVEKYDGRFSSVILSADDALHTADGTGIIDLLLRDFPSFRDYYIVTVNGERFELVFNKRAQLACWMAISHFRDPDYFPVKDLTSLSVFVDYNLPNIFRHMDILEYSPQLARAIDSGELLSAGGQKEIEIRAATLVAADILLDEINTIRDYPIYAPQLDTKLFSMRDSVDSSVHKTKTTSY